MNIAIITGASSGLGAEFARQIDQKCLGLDELWLLARREENMLALQETLKTKSRVICIDLSKIDEVNGILETNLSTETKIRMLVHCAGFGKSGLFEEVNEADSLGMLDLNCRSILHLTKRILPYMTKRSYIITMGSAAAFLPQQAFAVYAASKSFVLSFSRALGYELKEKKISVTCVCPGPVDTEFFEVSSPDGKPVGIKKFFLTKKEKVVTKALKDTFHKKQVSVYGSSMNAFAVLTKIVPTSLILFLYSKMS